jgi:hypothetical protein
MACMDLEGEQGPCPHGMDMVTLLVDYRHGRRGEKALMCGTQSTRHTAAGAATSDQQVTRRG